MPGSPCAPPWAPPASGPGAPQGFRALGRRGARGTEIIPNERFSPAEFGGMGNCRCALHVLARLRAGQPNLRLRRTSSPPDVRFEDHPFTVPGLQGVSIFRVRRKHSLPAAGIDRLQTIGADGQLRDVQPGQAADAADGGKQCGEETLGNLSGNNRMPGYCSGGLTSPDSVLTTAEDSLLEPPAATTRRRGQSCYTSSIAAIAAPRQRCGRA
jgi:hypothetical protein